MCPNCCKNSAGYLLDSTNSVLRQFLQVHYFWNSAGHLTHKINPNLSYFDLSYVYLEHINSVEWGTSVLYQAKTKYREYVFVGMS